MPGTVRLHRVLTAPPERVFKAFVDPEAMAKWLPPAGFTGKVHSIDARKGGSYKMSFTNFSTGKVQSFGGNYLDVEPGVKLRYQDRFDDPNLPGAMDMTITFKKVSVGTDLTVEQSGIPDAIPAEACYLGWQDSLDQLKKVVEPQIPD